MGNTCFFNSCLQCVLASKSFIMGLNEIRNSLQSGSLMKNLLELGTQETTSPRSVFRHLIRKNRVYGYYNQQDSQEAFANLLDIVENEIKKLKLREYRLTFQGYLVYQLHCFNCELTELLFQDNTTLMLDIERNADKYPQLVSKVAEMKTAQPRIGRDKNFIELNKKTVREHKNVARSGFNEKTMRIYEDVSEFLGKSDSSPPTRLEQMLAGFFEYSFFSRKKHDYKCEKCAEASTYAFKKYYIFRPPEVLVLCVKKFAKSKYSLFGKWTKSSVNVTYPEVLDLSRHMININLGDSSNGLYRLLGVVNHSGGLGGGHYTSYIRKNEQWYYISDSYYKVSSLKSALNADAYLVFYEKV